MRKLEAHAVWHALLSEGYWCFVAQDPDDPKQFVVVVTSRDSEGG